MKALGWVLAGVALAFTLAGSFSTGFYVVASVMACHEGGARYHLVTEWSPMTGCTTTVLGTKVKL